MGNALTAKEVAAILRISVHTLADWRRTGFGPPWFRLKGNDIRYPETGLKKWIEDRQFNSIAEERAAGRTYSGAAEDGGFR